MAFVCPRCNQVHPEGAATCEQAREMIEQRGREIDHEIAHHFKDHPGCPDPYMHVIRNRAKREGRDSRVY